MSDIIRRISIITLCVILLSACSTTQKAAEDLNVTRWPNFLRDWAAAEEIDNARQLAIIDQIDTLYRLVEDSTLDNELLCTKLCQLKDTLCDVIVNDTNMLFPFMMRATARNFYGMMFGNPWLIELNCPCEKLDFMVLDAKWNVLSRENFDLMYTTLIENSWLAPNRFANLMLSKEDKSELALTTLIVYNYIDTVINNLLITFIDRDGAIFERLTEEDLYVDSPDIGIKRVVLPPYVVMAGLANKGTIKLSYETKNDTVEMTSFSHVFFLEQIESCPRLKKVLNQALSELYD